MAATPGRFEVEDGEIIDTKARQIISLDQLAKLATPDDQDSIRQQIQDSGWAGADQSEGSSGPALARGTVSRPSVTDTPSQQDALPSRPSLQQFMEVAKQDNPDVPDKDLRRYWAQNYSDINPKTLPTLESFLPAAKEDNPGVSDQALKAYWEENYGDLGAAEKEAGDFGRGVSTAFKQIPQLGYGVAAGIGAAGESMLGEGGIATKLKEWGVAGYLEKSKDIYAQSKPSDDFTYSWDQAKQGNFGALVDWMQYGMGYMGAQGAQMLATAGAGSVAGRLAQGPVSSMAAGLVAKEAARLKATQSGATLAAEELAKVATANVASRIGQTTALAAAATGMEGGEIFGDLSAESVKSGQPLSGEQLAKAFGATLAAGSLEFVGDKLGIDLMLGKTLAGKMGGRAARMGTSAAAGAAVEGGTEVGQTLIEEYGKGRDAFSPEAMREAVNAGALGALGGTVYGGAGGIVARKDEPPASIPVESIPDQIGVGDPTVSIEQAITNAQDILSAPVSLTRPQEDALSSRLAQLADSTASQREADRIESERQLQSGERLPSAQEAAMQTDGIPRTGQDIPILEGPQSSPSTLPIADPSRLWMDEAVVPGIEPGQAFTPRASSEPDAKARLQAERERLLSMRKTPSAPSDMAQPVMSETPAPSDIPLQSAADLAYPPSERGRMPTQEELALRDRGPAKRAAQQVPLIDGGEGDTTSTIIPGATFSPRQEPVLTPKERLAAEREKLVRMKATRPAPMPSEPTVPPSSTPSDAPLRSAVDRAYPSVSDLHDLARDKGFDVESPVFKTLTKMSTGKTHLDELSPSARDRFAETLKKLTPRETPTIVESPTKKALAPVQPGSPDSDAVTAPRSTLPPEQNAEMLLRAEKANADLESSSEMQDESLIDFLKSKGGLQDQGGELSTMEVDAQRKAFSKKLIQQKGLTLDQAAELAHEAGYIKDRDIALLLDGIDKEVRGKGQHADWYRELTTGPKPMTREAIDTAVGKIIEDHGVDTGAAVERVKAALLNDGEFDGTQWGEDAASIARGDWPAWIPKPDVPPQQGATPQQEPVSASPSTKGTTTTPPQSEAATVQEEEPFSLTQQAAKADKPKPKATQLSIDVPPPTVGERPIIGREVTPEEAPLFSEAAKQPDAQQLDIAQDPEPVAPNAAPEVAPSATEILASALRTAADQIEGKKAESKKPSTPQPGSLTDVGEERTRINAAFDSLVGSLKTEETDAGIRMYNRDMHSDPSTEEAQEVQGAIEGKTPLEAAQYLAQSAPSEDYRLIAGKVAERIEALQSAGMTFSLHVAHVNDKVPAALIRTRGMAWLPNKSTATQIWIQGSDVTGYVGTSYETVLHELLHAATQSALYVGNLRSQSETTLGRSVKDLYDVTNAIIGHFNNRSASAKRGETELTPFELAIFERRNNALSDPGEVISWAFTNRDMQQYLESIPYRQQTLWSRFVDAIRSMLGLSAKQGTALSEVLRLGEEIMDSPANSMANSLRAVWMPTQVNQYGGLLNAQRNATDDIALTYDDLNSPNFPGITTTPEPSPNVPSRSRVTKDLTDAQRAALARVHGTKETWAERLDTFKKTWKRELVQGLFDQYAPILDYSKKGYILSRMAKSGDGTLEALMLYGKPYVDSEGAYRVDYTESGGMQGFSKVLSSLQGEHDRFLEWVAAQRAGRLKSVGLENLYREEDIATLKTLNQGKMPDGASREASYLKALSQLNEWNDAMVKIGVDSGLISEEAREQFKNVPYVPFYRLQEEGLVTGFGKKPGLVNQYAWKKLKGGTAHLNDDLLANLLQNWSHIITASAKNRAAKETLTAAKQAGVAEEIPSGAPGKGHVHYLENGKEVTFTVSDPALMDAVAALHYAGLGSIGKPFTAMKRALSFAVTVNPAYKIRNLIRDSIQAIGTSDLSYNPLKNMQQGAKATRHEAETRAQLLAGGGMMRFGSMLDGNDTTRTRRLIESGVDPETILSDAGAIEKVWKRLIQPAFQAYQEFGDRGEQLNRAALYEQLLKKGMTHQEASFWARDLMDFSMSGKWAGVRILTQIVPFMNARLQGLYKLGRASKQDYRKLATTLGAVALASIGLMLAYQDDEDWKKREDFDRENYWWFKVGNTAFRLPKPFEIGVVGTIAERSVEYLVSREMTGERFGERLAAVVFSQLSMNPTPQLVKPLMDLYANKDAFTGRPIESMGMERLRKEDRYTDRTSETAKFLGSLGLPDPAQLAMGRWNTLSPVQVDSLVRGYFSWLGSTTMTALDYGIRPMLNRGERPDMTLKEAFLVGNFAESLPNNSSRYMTQFYGQATEIEQAYNSYRDALKRGDTEGAASIMEDERDKLSQYHMVEHVKRQESKLNEQIKLIERSQRMSGEEKRARIDELQQRKQRLVERVNDRQLATR